MNEPIQTPNPNPPDHNSVTFWSVLGIVFVVMLGIGYWVWQESSSQGCKEGQRGGCVPMIISGNEVGSWKTYRNEEYGFEVKTPQNWALRDGSTDKNWTFQSISFDKHVRGFDLPPSGNMVVRIFKDLSAPCNDSDYSSVTYFGVVDYAAPGDYPPDPHAETLLKVICRGQFKIMLEIWANDRNLDAHKMRLETVLSTFKFIN